jgi:DNA topoisomerase-1
MSEELVAYCVKCKTKRPLINAQPVFTKGGTPATQGICATCGTRLYLMGETPAHAGLERPVVEPRPARKKTSTKSRRAKRKARPAPRKPAKTAAPAAPVRRRGRLVIVESPAKARTIENYLGKDYRVRASIGHVRDLPRSRLGVDIERDFAPTYSIPPDKREVVQELRAAAAQAEEVYLATDLDREGEAIAWHLIAAAEIDPKRTRRVVFSEITQDAIREAFANPRGIDMDLVNAQQARRVLDRLVGYELSPLLWKKVRPRLSAGRVQSVAVRLIVEREREIEQFIPEEYWIIDAELARAVERDLPDRLSFVARLQRINDQPVNLTSEEAVRPILADLEQAEYVVDAVKKGERTRVAPPPFTTSTVQQEASRRLAFTTRRTMSLAQELYEGVDIGNGGAVGLITYMRTDSTNVSQQARQEAAAYIGETFGKAYLPETANVYNKKARGAQEAHEAIRPTSVYRTPESLRTHLSRDQLRLYRLIWQRFVASQMAPAIYDTVRVDVLAGPPGAAKRQRPYLFRASGSTLRFPGFLAVYADFTDDESPADEELGRVFPDLADGDLLDLLRLLPEQRFTQPPSRYTEASLVKALEENGIGRPSTYASILGTIQERGYVERAGKILTPTETGIIVNDLLVQYFPEIVDLNFTARMEDALDAVASGEHDWVPLLHEFYAPFKADLEHARADAPSVEMGGEEIGRACPQCGRPLVIRWGRYGKFIGCSDFPNCRYTEPLLEKTGAVCPLDGGEIIARRTRRGRTFYGCANYPACAWTSWKRPLPDPCPSCGGLLVVHDREYAQCLACGDRVLLSRLPSAEKQAQSA